MQPQEGFMFWKETLRLRTLPVVTKIIISLFLVLTGIGYLLGFTNIYLTYNLVDEKPGLSLKDISLTYYGVRDKTTLEKAIDGPCPAFLQFAETSQGKGCETGRA